MNSHNELHNTERGNMLKYNFFYDETEHSRRLNYNTVTAENYYDNFVTMIVGWNESDQGILQRHASFEKKYEDRRDKNGEILLFLFFNISNSFFELVTIFSFLFQARWNFFCFRFSKSMRIICFLMQI